MTEQMPGGAEGRLERLVGPEKPMQYLLTETELLNLRRAADEKVRANKTALQRACTLAAKHTPVTRPWSPEAPPKPWGCILEKDNHPGYCDECPVQDVCPHEGKEYSQ